MMTKATVGTDVRNFVYTADDERIAVKQGLSWTWSVRDQGGKVLREFTSIETSNPFALSGHTWSKDYVWRDGQLLASTSIPAGYTTPITYHYHLNHLGTPRMITRDNGIVVSNHNYYPFGSEMDLTLQESPAEAMKFTGHERDIVAGSNHSVDYMHARYYNGNLGRFLEVDPVLGHPTTPQSWNRYSYVHNNPTKNVDPDGREVWVSAEMQAAVTFGNMFSPAFRAQYLQFRDDPRVYWLIRGENQAASGTRARSQPLALQLDVHGHVTHAGEISYIPRFVGVNEQAKLIAHEGGHLGEEVSTGRTVQDRYKSHENGISLNVAAGENHYESRQVLAFEQLVADELRSNTTMLPVSKPIVMNMLDLTPAQK